MRAVLLVLAFAFAVPAAAQQQVRFTGHTTVDAVVIRDSLQQVAQVAAGRERCTELTAVEARVLPADYRPPDPGPAPADARYERWDVTLCGRIVPFLLGFWHPSEGGTMFRITHPFPTGETPH